MNLDYLLYLCFRWPGKKYVIVCPPPVPRKTAAEAKEAKQAKRFSETVLSPSQVPEKTAEDLKGVMYYEYDVMFHFLFASLRRADGANSVTSAGVKTFNIFAGPGLHRYSNSTLQFQAMCHLTITGILCVHQPQFTAGGIS